MRLKVLRQSEFTNEEFSTKTFLFHSVFSVPANVEDKYKHIYSTVFIQ